MITLLDFYSETCAPCKIMDPIVNGLEKKFMGLVEVKKINTSDHLDLVKKSEINTVPTYIIMKEGQEVFRRSGAIPPGAFEKILASHV